MVMFPGPHALQAARSVHNVLVTPFLAQPLTKFHTTLVAGWCLHSEEIAVHQQRRPQAPLWFHQE